LTLDGRRTFRLNLGEAKRDRYDIGRNLCRTGELDAHGVSMDIASQSLQVYRQQQFMNFQIKSIPARIPVRTSGVGVCITYLGTF
jgi:hypothetical protein